MLECRCAFCNHLNMKIGVIAGRQRPKELYFGVRVGVALLRGPWVVNRGRGGYVVTIAALASCR